MSIPKMWIKFLRTLVIFLVISGWTFSSWSQIWQNGTTPAVVIVQSDFILTGNDNFRVDEKPEFRIHIPVKMAVKMTVKKSVAKLLGLFGAQTASAQSPMPRLLKSEVVDHTGKKMNVESSAELIGREIKITVPKPASRQFQPGKFTLNVEMLDGEEIITKSQDFTWGVLAINTNKSVFLPGETAYLQMTSLNEYGRASCDSKLELKIKNSESGAEKIFFTESGTIKKSDTCGPNNVTDSPDYFAYYETAAPGIYQMHLTNLDTGYDTIDSFEVREHVPLEVERVGATRINPFLSNYKMTLRIKADQDFDGTVTEKMPSDFEVIDAGGGIAGNNAAEKEIIWKVNLKNGEQTTLQYEYKAPEISPEIFLLGPAEFIQDGSAVFTEARQWQIGSDVIYNCTLTISGATNWNGAAWGTCNSSYPGATGTADTATIAASVTATLTLNVSPANALGAVSMTRPAAGIVSTLAISTFNLTAASVALLGTTLLTRATNISVNTGTLTVTGALTSAGIGSGVAFVGAGTVNVGGVAGFMSGTVGTFTKGTASTINLNGTSAQTQTTAYTYNTFKVNNAAGVTLAGAATITTLTIGDITPSSIFNDGGQTITPGASSVLNLTSGTYNLGSAGTATTWPAWGTRNITSGTTIGYVSGAAQSVSTTPTEYKNVTFSGAGTKTVAAGGTLTVTGNFDTTSGTATFTTTANLTVTGNITNNGAITMGSGTLTIGGNWTNSGTFTAGTGLVDYNTATGGQTIGGVTYNNLTLSNSSNTDTAGGAMTVNGTLTTTSGGTLDMSTYQLLGTVTPTNNGAITTSNTTNPAIPASKNWTGTTGTVTFALAGGGQFIPAGTYKTLTLSNTSGTDTAAGAITATTLTTGSSILDMVTYDLAVTNITNNGTIKTQSVSTTPLSANKTWGGTVNFNAGSGTTQTIVYGTYNILTATAALARTIKFNASQTTNVTTWTVTGSSGQLITLTTDTGTTQWIINPTAASVSYVDASNSSNTGASFCATNSISTSGNNTLWNISSGASCTTAPTVTTSAATSLTSTTAVLNGDITATGGANATVRGFAWGTNSGLSGGDTATTSNDTGSFGVSSFNTNPSPLTGLTCNTTYYSRAYATNPVGDGLGGISAPFTTSACPIYSVSITPAGDITYGFVSLSNSTTTIGSTYTKTATNDGNTAEKLNVKSSDATTGTQWTLASTIGTNQFKHEFSTTTGAAWTVMSDSATYVTAKPSVAVSGTVSFDFRLTAPSSSSDYQQKSITITVQAVAP